MDKEIFSTFPLLDHFLSKQLEIERNGSGKQKYIFHWSEKLFHCFPLGQPTDPALLSSCQLTTNIDL